LALGLLVTISALPVAIALRYYRSLPLSPQACEQPRITDDDVFGFSCSQITLPQFGTVASCYSEFKLPRLDHIWTECDSY